MKLHFVADDFGANAETNTSTVTLLSGGIPHSVSVLASTTSVYPPHQERTQDALWGAHLYLTEFPPLTERLGTLWNGRGISKRTLVAQILTGQVSQEDFALEFMAQLNRLAANGFTAQFIDSHMNIHWLPVVFPAIMSVAKKRGLSENVRPFAQLNFSLAWSTQTYFSLIRAKALSFKTNSRVLVNCPGYKLDNIDLNLALKLWDNFLTTVKAHNYGEIVVPCHPGLSPAEVQIYSSPGFKQLLEKHAVTTK